MLDSDVSLKFSQHADGILIEEQPASADASFFSEFIARLINPSTQKTRHQLFIFLLAQIQSINQHTTPKNLQQLI